MEIINLFGASGHAKVIADIITAQGNDVGKVYDDVFKPFCISGRDIISPNVGVEEPLIISIGSPKFRRLVSERFPVVFSKAIHPSAIISESSKIGEGSVVMQGAIVQAESVIGRHCIVNTGASIDHECLLGDFVHVSPHATLCGCVQVGDNSWIGAGSVVIQGIRIGKNVMIGAGSVVVDDIPDNVVAFGNPCKIIREKFED